MNEKDFMKVLCVLGEKIESLEETLELRDWQIAELKKKIEEAEAEIRTDEKN